MKNVLKKAKTNGVDDFKRLSITSNAFENGERIPSRYTCDGRNVNPPLSIKFIPEDAKCLVIMVIDFDTPLKPWIHWMLWNVPITHHIKENTNVGISGINDFSNFNYNGPCPNLVIHHYYFKVYALKELLILPISTTSVQLEKAMSEKIIAFGEIIGTYVRM
jgi:Raf kinase inhibitor-like YbhB/YbcL family protein